MLTCPLCKKALKLPARECPFCRSDLTLLADFVGFLQVGLAKADTAVRAGALGEAIWAYLAVLEVDPENAEARRQVGLVATAVRQFDKVSAPRRWAFMEGVVPVWRLVGIGAAVLAVGLAIGYIAGRLAGPLALSPEEPPPAEKTLK